MKTLENCPRFQGNSLGLAARGEVGAAQIERYKSKIRSFLKIKGKVFFFFDLNSIRVYCEGVFMLGTRTGFW